MTSVDSGSTGLDEMYPGPVFNSQCCVVVPFLLVVFFPLCAPLRFSLFYLPKRRPPFEKVAYQTDMGEVTN
jgi:hypothetical protein